MVPREWLTPVDLETGICRNVGRSKVVSVTCFTDYRFVSAVHEFAARLHCKLDNWTKDLDIWFGESSD